MLPWVKCALKASCIAPLGSKFYGCNYLRRPFFLYSGCHRYEQSAFSIIVSLFYKFDESKYTTVVNKDPKSANSSYIYFLNKNEQYSGEISTFYVNSFMSDLNTNKFDNSSSKK